MTLYLHVCGSEDPHVQIYDAMDLPLLSLIVNVTSLVNEVVIHFLTSHKANLSD